MFPPLRDQSVPYDPLSISQPSMKDQRRLEHLESFISFFRGIEAIYAPCFRTRIYSIILVMLFHLRIIYRLNYLKHMVKA